MGQATEIAWCDATWNPIRGCSRVSAGCGDGSGGGCYAERQAHRFSGPGGAYEGLTRITPTGPKWTGVVRLVPDKLDWPLRTRTAKRIFVNSMSDLFHESLSDGDIDRVFAVMAIAPRHTFQVLTKRPKRMRAYLSDPTSPWRIAAHVRALDRGCSTVVAIQLESGSRIKLSEEHIPAPSWPLDHVWAGVSVEDQGTADERIPLLLQTPAAVRFLSVEPMLGPVEFSDVTRRSDSVQQLGKPALSGIDWVIVGGESGPGARPCNVEWIRSIVQQCKAARVPAFVKQLGAAPTTGDMEPTGKWRTHEGRRQLQMAAPMLQLVDRKGGDPAEWPEDLRVREFPAIAPEERR